MTMTTEAFVGHLRSVDDLEPPAGEGRSAAIHRRIRRVRRRRAAAGVLAVAVVLGTAAGIVTAARSPESPARLAADHGLPASITQPDGVVYRVSAVATLDTGEQPSVTTAVPAPHGVVSVMAACDSAGDTPFAPTGVRVTSPGDPDGVPFLCAPRVGPADMDVSAAPQAGGTVTMTITDQDLVRPTPVIWYVAFYTWQVPSHIALTTPLPALPSTLDGYALYRSFAGTLASLRAVTLQIPPHTSWGVVPVCGAALRYAPAQAQRTGSGAALEPVDLSTGGLVRAGQSCNVVASATDPSGFVIDADLSAVVPPIDGQVTIAFTYPKAYDLRPASWELGVYVKPRAAGR